MPRDSFDEAWVVGGIPQGFAQALDRIVQPLIEINERVSRPDPPSYFLPGYHFAGTFQKDLQDLERLILELDLDAPLAQFSRTQINFEHAETNRPTRWMSAFHPS